MRSRLTLPLLVALTIAGYGYGIQGSVPDVPTGQWMSGASLGQPREGAVSVALDDGRVLVIGGRTAAGPVATVEALNVDGSITALSPMAAPRVGHTAVRLGDGSVLVAGGTTLAETDQGTVEAPTSSVEIFMPGGDAWIAGPPLNVARTGHTATVVADGRVLVAGGTNEQGSLDSTEVFEPLQGAFRTAGVLSTARSEAAAARAGDTLVLVVGGRNADGVLATADLIDVDSGSLAQLAMTSPRTRATATRLLDGSILVAGGNNGTDDLATAEVIDPVTGVSSPVGSMAQPRSGQQATLLDYNANVLIVGGTNAEVPVATTEHFIPWTGQFVAYSPTVGRGAAVLSGTDTEGVAFLAAGKTADGTLIAPTALYGFATVKTDNNDYQPGQFVTITGSGWQPGETVTLVLHEIRTGEPDVTLLATADANGNIFNDVWAPNEYDLGVRFYLTASGAGSQAQTTFTDSRTVTSATLNGGTSVTVLTGATISATVNVTTDNGGGNSNWRSTGWRISTSAPGAVTCVDHPNHDAIGSFSETFNITAPATVGTFNAYFIAYSDNACSNQASATFSLPNGVVTKGATTTTINTDTPDPSTVGQAVTITYSVATSPSGTATGNVTVTDGTQSCTGTVAGGSCSITFATAGAKSLTATYAGDTSFNGSTSAAAAHTVNAAATTTTITSDTPDPSVVGQPVAVSYTVTSAGGTPTGSVTVSSGADSCTSTVAAGTCNLTFTSAGAKSITATYAGNSNFGTSTSAGVAHQVDAANTTTAITSDTPDPSVVGQPVTVNYSVAVQSPGAGAPTGTVTVSDGTNSCSASVLAGTCSITFTTAGAKSLTATYAGDTNFNGSASTPATAHTVNKADTTTTITSDTPDPSVVGQPVTVNYSVVVQAPGAGSPTGNVTVSDGTNSCTGTVAAGSCAITFTSAGAKSLTASYAGDTNFNNSTSAAAPHQVDKANTTTAITSDAPDPSVVGQPVTIAFTVTVNAPGSGTPTGNVTVSDGTQSCTATVAAGSCSISFASTGSRSLTASYAGDSNFNTSTSASESHQVDKAATTTTITADTPDSSVVGQAVAINFSVAVNSPGVGTPTGNVTVSSGSDSCSATVAAGTCSITFTTAGSHPLTASYEGDANFNGSTSAAEPHTVDKANTTTTITSDTPDPSVVGQPVTVNFSVTVNAPGAGTPTGSVTVGDGTDTCTGTVAAGTCSITFTSAGAKSLTASYAGDTNFNTSTSAAATHQVDKADTTTTISSDNPDPSVVGQPVTVNFSVTVNAPGSGSPSGSVTVGDGTDSCTGTVASGTCTISFASAGAKSLTATYAGDANFNGSTSAAATHQVDKANTTTAITSDNPDPSVVGQPVTVAFSVTVDAPGSGTPGGSVTVSDGTESCTGTVASGSCAITFTSAGAKSLTATYAGDANFNGSASAAASHQVDKANTTTTITADNPDPSVVGQSVTVNFSVTVNAPGSGTPTGSVTVSDGTESCSGTVASGSCVITFGSAGAKSLTATYAGDANFNGSTSAAESHQVDKANTTTTITSDNPDPSVVGQPVTIDFSVTVNAPGSGTPTGSVTVSDGTQSCTGTVAAGNCSITFTSAGAKSLTATYLGDSNFNGSTSAAATHQVDKANTTSTITSDNPDPSVVGEAVVVNYTVAVQAPGAGTPAGNVTVSAGADSCTGTVASGTCTITFTSAGSKSLTASYAGDSNFNGSTSASAPHTVNKADTTTTITSDGPDPSVVGQPVTVNFSVTVDAPGSGTPTGSVTVSDGADSCTGTVASGGCVITFATAGAKSLTATYAGDDNFNGSTSAAASHQVDKANTTTTITSDLPDPSVVGQPVTVEFSVTVNAPGSGAPTGSVTVSDGSDSCTGTVAAGSCVIGFTSTGAKSLTATYAGDANFNGSASAAEAHQVDKANTTTTITSDTPDPSVVGQPVPVTFSVTVNSPGAGTPTGSVTLSNGSTSCTTTVALGGCSLTFSTAGSHPITATYAGDANFNGSASAAEPHQVDKAGTTTTITSDAPDPSVVGQPVTIAFSVTVNAPGSGMPTGSVTVSNGVQSCSGTVAAGSCSIAFSTAGPHPVTATYSGDANFDGSASAAEPHQVDKASTSTTITSDLPDPSVVGESVTVNFTVAVQSPGVGTATGNVVVSDGTESCTGTVASGSCVIAFTSAGAKSLTATYAGDSNFNGSTSAAAPHTVDKADTTTTITADTPDPSVVGQPVTVNFSVTVDAPGSGTPAGNVTVSDGTDSCIGTVAAGSCVITFGSAGAKSLTATYAGDTNFNGSVSAAASHQVNKADTTVAITSDTPDPSVAGQPVPVQFAVSVTAPGSGVPTGNVTVTDGTISCTATVAAGQCNLTFASTGARSLVATYAGDTNFNGSASPAEAHQVNTAATTTAITSDAPDPSVVGQLVSVAFSVTVNAPGSGTPTGNVTVTDGTISCTATVAAGSCNLTFTSAGARSLTATYAGDSNFDGSASAIEPHQVNKAGTTTTITNDTPDPSVVGQSVTVNFTVAVNAPGVGTPTGNVTVSDGAVSCTATVAAGQCSLVFGTAGAKSLTATYAGDSNFNGSASAAESHQVNQAATTTTITSDTPDPSVVGQPVTINFSVGVNAPGSGSPTGNVTVSDGTQSCTGTVAAGSCSITFTTAGAKSLVATYAGDANFSGSASAVAPHQVNKANTTTTVLSDTPDPSVVGQPVTVTYSVVVNSPGSGTPTGSVTVSDGTTSCTGTVAAGSCSLSFPTVGSHPVTATYAGDANFNGSASAAAPHTVNKADTATTIVSDTPDPSLVNAPYTVTWSTVVSSPGSGSPTGTVTVSDGTSSCSAAVATGSCSLASTSAGTKTLVATYAGDTNFKNSASTPGTAHNVTYTFAGFFAPVDNLPVINSAKAGSAIPTKWRLTDAAGNGISDPASFVSFTSYTVACGAWGTAITDPVPEDYSGNSGLQYLGNGNWQWNWKTPKDYVNQCRVARITLNDGSIHEYDVKFK